MSALNELVIASHNKGKLREIEVLVAPLGIEVFSAADLDLPEPEETGDTFEANAALKSESAMILSGKASLSDDSGLCIPALGGAPGIYSARWAGKSKDFALASERIRRELIDAGIEPEGADAYFVCVLALSVPKSETLFFRGEVHGCLTFPPRGDRGFGYDPIFIPQNQSLTFAQMPADAKHAISHRARAFDLFLAHLGIKPA